MSAHIYPVSEVIPQSKIIIFSPHYDDFLFMLGGFAIELKKYGLLHTKEFNVKLIFSRSNYLAGSRNLNADNSLQRIQHVTGIRLLEDEQCLNALLGRYNYGYELLGEDECFTRGKKFADSEMEFPHGMFEDFNEDDVAIFERMKQRIRSHAAQEDAALIFPIAFKEHIDHYIVREAAVAVAKEMGVERKAVFYFQEDKPYGGIATADEQQRINDFINSNGLHPLTYPCDPEAVIEYAFKHYVSQVEEVYKKGIRGRAEALQQELGENVLCDRIYRLPQKLKVEN